MMVSGQTTIIQPAIPSASGRRPNRWTQAETDFLCRVVPWPGANDPGYINLHCHLKNDKQPAINGGKPFVVGWPFRSIGDFVNRAIWIGNTNHFFDVWFCTSLQRESKPSTRPGGAPKAVRLHRNAIALKALWVDIDVKPGSGNHYVSAEDAWLAVSTFRKKVGLPAPSAVVNSGGGLHVYWISDTALAPADWRGYADGLKALLLAEGVKCDAGLTTDDVRILRVPGTLNHKYDPPKPVTLLHLGRDYNFSVELSLLREVVPATGRPSTSSTSLVSRIVPGHQSSFGSGPDPAFAALTDPDHLAAGIKPHQFRPLDPGPVFENCGFMHHARVTGGADYDNPLWNLSVLCTAFMENGNDIAHEISKGHAKYTQDETQQHYERKVSERDERGLGWPSCGTIQSSGCKACGNCQHLAKGRSPLHLSYEALGSTNGATRTSQAEPSFVDPYSEFVGPDFPLDVLTPTLAAFVKAEHYALGADPAAIAMAALTVLAGAINAETQVQVGEGWWEKPIIWTELVGPPSAMKSPIVDRVKKPLSRIDHERTKRWRHEHAKWLQDKKADKTIPCPVRLPRCVINDVTAEKVAEILSREPCGSLMVHDELAGWFESFERYNSGSSRALFLSAWNGGIHTKDRVGNGKQDADAEICVDNLALSILGCIQPERLAKFGDLTSDGLLQRFLPVLMKSAERGDQDYPVRDTEAAYDKLITSANDAPPQNYQFEDDALEIRDRVFDYLHRLEKVDGFQPSLIGAIGKLKGYFARICLVLHVAHRYDALIDNETVPGSLPPFTAADRDQLYELFGLAPSGDLSAGINVGASISRRTAEAAEKVLREFLLPHMFSFYDVVMNGGQERDKLKSIGDFILACNKDRLRPSDFSAGVRALRGVPEQKLREWVGRFCGMDWLTAEEIAPGAPPKAWNVTPGLRECFAERRKQAQAAPKEAHQILKAGGSRRLNKAHGDV